MTPRTVLLPLALLLANVALAEEKSDLGPEQRLRPDTDISVEILDPASETILYIGSIIDPITLLPRDVDVSLQSPLGVTLGTFSSGSVIVPTAGIGTYSLNIEDLDLDGDLDPEPLEEWEITVLQGATPVLGRVWSKRWRIDAAGFASLYATDGSFYVVVEGGALGTEGVVELKPEGLAGFKYSLIANSDGIVDGEGRSRFDTALWTSIGKFEVYLAPPDPALVSYTFIQPDVTAASITPEATCGAIAPGLVGAGADVVFTSNVSGVAHLICDLDDNGIYDLTSDDDFHLLTDVTAGLNGFVWDGTNNLGVPVPAGVYDCNILVTVGEFHFVANDIETSYGGFRVFEVSSALSRTGLPMYWNDAEVQFQNVLMPNLQFGLETSGPFGIASGAYLAAVTPNVNARSWGNFTSISKGNNALLDTYTWLADDEVGPFQVDVRDATIDTDGDTLLDAEEECLYGTSPLLVDTDDDGAGDHAEVTVGASDPVVADTDGDGIDDGAEMPDPYLPPDTDSDGFFDPSDDDDDDDGVLTLDEPQGDVDNDGSSNHLDDDDDGDGIDTIDEDTNGDGDWFNDNADGDALPDFLDDDDDNDGVLLEPDTDTDGNGVPDYLDPDDDGDGIPSSVEYDFDGDGTPDDTDTDGIPNYLDPDDDGDGLDTLLEGGGNADGDTLPDFLDTDSDDDTVLDSDDGLGDTDGDGLRNFEDPDDDGDTLPTIFEDPNGDGDPTNDDSDGDGLTDYLDPDDDDDTVLTEVEWDRDADGVPDDSDGDEIPDYLDPDDDNDGIPTSEEGDGDTDGDGLPDYLDPDSDNDTIFDREEGTRDSDSDFVPDFQDIDDDGDGILSIEELGDAAGTPGTLTGEADLDNAPDTDGDRDPDWLDADDDDDTIPTLQEGGFEDDMDGDGTPNHHDLDSDGDALEDELEEATDRDGDGAPNFLDLDADGDGFDDSVELDTDTDGDGTSDFLDEDDDDDKVRSIDEARSDTDGDGLDDRIDPDDDGDGIPTATEFEDGLVQGSDPDEDDLPNWVDLDSDDDQLSDEDEGTRDEDRDGIPNYLDPDGSYLTWYRGSGLSIACNGSGGGPVGALASLVVMFSLLLRRRPEER